MPNDVYGTARRELIALVSPRAAERVLDNALASVNVSRDAVTARQMRALITGPIQKDLRSILPTPGLNRVLRRITEDLRAVSASPTGSSAIATDHQAHAATAVGSVQAPVAVHVPREPSRILVQPEPRHASRKAQAPLAAADLSQEQVERFARSLARLPHVLGVTVVRQREVRFARGSGVDANRAAEMIPVAAKLASRHGPWRSYTLVHELGHLFIIPAGRDYIAVTGRSDFNLGAVLTALAALEEEL